jgi:hypothetical protein
LPYGRSIRQRPLEREGRSIWRYISLRKLEDMVSGRHLFFTRLRHIVDREIDVFEGALADVNLEEPNVNVNWFLQEVLAPGQPQETIDAVRRQFGDVASLRDQQEWGREHTYVHCWFIGEFESERMWREYVPDGRGVVVQSTIRKLRYSFDATPGDIYILPVIYHDPASRRMVPVDVFHTPLYKRDTYRHEQELRCFVLAPQIHQEYVVHPDGIGVWVPCNVGSLVDRVRVPPGAEDDLVDQVHTILRAAGLPTIAVERSALRGARAAS